jgi:hypothetical protein
MGDTGVLSFALGLQAGGFLGPLGQASGAMKGFIASALGFSGAMAGIVAAVNEGAALEHLHRRTGEGVADLYELQKGFKAAGLEAEDVSPTLFKMQQSLGGINEMGERTDDIFRRMGLDIRKLKGERGADALNDIMKALGRLNRSDAAMAASSIFGRGEGANMVQLSRSSAAFAEGMAHAAKDAQTFANNSKSFEKLSRTWDELKDKGMSFFAGIAAAAAPAVQEIVDDFGNMDFSSAGSGIGDFVSTLVEAFKEGRLSEALGVALREGFELGLEGLRGLLPEIVVMLNEALSDDLTTRVKRLGAANMLDQVKDPAVRKRMASAVNGMISADEEHGNDVMTAMHEIADENFKAALGKMKETLGENFKYWSQFQIPKKAASADEPGEKPGTATAELNAHYGTSSMFTSLEKMGFVTKGLNNPLANDGRTTAQNTGRTVYLLQTILTALGGPGARYAFPVKVGANQPL